MNDEEIIQLKRSDFIGIKRTSCNDESFEKTVECTAIYICQEKSTN